jgi:stress response protein YsnF
MIDHALYVCSAMTLLVMAGCSQSIERRESTTMTHETSGRRATASSLAPGEELVVPVVREEAHVTTQRTVTGRVRVTKTVQDREVLVQEPSRHEEVEVERVAVNRFISEPATVRYEGDTMIVPVMEEVAVVETRLRLKEELRITKRQITTDKSQPVRLRTEEVHVERVPVSEPSAAPNEDGPTGDQGQSRP